MTDTDYRVFYNLEPHLLDVVRHRFAEQGYLSAFDFFCIIIWKANRAKSKIARRLLRRGYTDLDAAARALTTDITRQLTAPDRLHVLLHEWGFHLPMASAILTVLYPDEFTVYDARVCDALGAFYDLGNLSANSNRLWRGYLDYRDAVMGAGPANFSLRDKDRFLWGRAFFSQLKVDIARGFRSATS